MTHLADLVLHDDGTMLIALPIRKMTLEELERVLAAAQAADEALNEQPASLPAEEGAAEDPSPVAAAPDPLSAEELGHGPWFVAEGVEHCVGCRMRRHTLELIQSQASHELHAAIDAPDSPPAAGEAEDGKAEQGTGTRPASAVGPSSPPPTDSVECPTCGKYLGSAANIGRHQRFCKGRPEPTPVEPLESVTDPRVIDEHCRKCDQRFTWRPALVNHERACRGAEAVAS